MMCHLILNYLYWFCFQIEEQEGGGRRGRSEATKTRLIAEIFGRLMWKTVVAYTWKFTFVQSAICFLVSMCVRAGVCECLCEWRYQFASNDSNQTMMCWTQSYLICTKISIKMTHIQHTKKDDDNGNGNDNQHQNCNNNSNHHKKDKMKKKNWKRLTSSGCANHYQTTTNN